MKRMMTMIGVVMVIAAGCKKEMQSPPEIPMLDSSKISRLPRTAEEKLLVKNLSFTTEVLKELYKDNQNLKLVNASIFSRAYTDGSILLRDLIYPEQSLLKSNRKFSEYVKAWKLDPQRFSNNFWREAEKMGNAEFNEFLRKLGGGVATSNARSTHFEEEITIYFPYEEVTHTEDPNGYYEPVTSLTTATADADEGWGDQPYYSNGVLQYYRQVLINDEYAINNPTQIVGLNGIEPYVEPVTVNTAFPPEGPIDLPDLVREVKQVYIGELRIYKHQYDKLISFTGNGGGSEIRLTRADGYLKVVDGQVQIADVYHTPAKVISRHQISEKIWVNYNMEWDGDWEKDNLQQNLAIYEEDNRNTATFNGSLSTTVAASVPPISATAVRAIGFSINYKSDDDLIRQTTFNRDVFFILNRTNLEGELRNGWPIRDRNSPVSYTLNDRTFY